MAGPSLLPDAPAWFARAVAVPYDDRSVDVDGCPVHYLAWGEPGRRGLVFVHGGGAHAHWWTPVAATFAGQFRVAAIDLSGHGDSGHRAVYDLEQWTDEVVAVAPAAWIDGLPVVIGHTMGGFVTIATAARHADEVAGVVVCDSPVAEVDPEISAYHLRRAFGRPRTYPTVEDAVAHFRTVPAPGALPRLRHRLRGPPLAQAGRRAAGSGSSTGGSSSSSPAHALHRRALSRARWTAGWRCCARSTDWSPRTSAPPCTRSWAG